MNSEASTGFARSAKAGRRFIAWNVPAKGVKTKRQQKINVKNTTQKTICVALATGYLKTANFLHKAIPSTRQSARLGVLLVKALSGASDRVRQVRALFVP
jgi:hypothetical protein